MLLALVLAAAIAAPCPWGRAHYEMVGEPSSTISVVPLPPPPLWGNPDLGLRIADGGSGRVLWFYGDGGSASLQHLISMNDPTLPGWQAPDQDSRRGRPGPDLIVMGYDAHLNAAGAVAYSSGTAAAYLVIPEIADAFRVAEHRPSNTIYRLSACDAR